MHEEVGPKIRRIGLTTADKKCSLDKIICLEKLGRLIDVTDRGNFSRSNQGKLQGNYFVASQFLYLLRKLHVALATECG